MSDYTERKIRQQRKRIVARNEELINKIWLKIRIWFCPYGGKTYQIKKGKSILIKKEKYLDGKTYIVYDKPIKK